VSNFLTEFTSLPISFLCRNNFSVMKFLLYPGGRKNIDGRLNKNEKVKAVPEKSVNNIFAWL